MTEDTPTTNPGPTTPKRRGWPKGKPRAKPLPKTAVEAAVKRAVDRPSLLSRMKSRPNWDDDTAVSVGEEGVDRLHIDQRIVEDLAAEGVALQWITHQVRGQDAPQEMSRMVKGGWTPVHQSDFDGVLDGLFMPKGQDSVVTVDDCMLAARPMHIQQSARVRERRMARAPLAIKEAELGRGLNVPGGDHISATRQNSIKKTIERIEIPE
jgi:hypothetical protein